MNTTEIVISLRIDSSFITLIKVVNNVKEGGMLKRGCAVEHASITSDKTAWPVVRNYNGGGNGVDRTVRQGSECHQNLAYR